MILQPVVFSMNVMADSLHTLLCASPDVESRTQLQNAFFSYLSLGGIVVRGQAQLISGLNSNPMTLVLNLLAAAFYIFGAMLFPLPSPRKLTAAAQLVLVICSTSFQFRRFFSMESKSKKTYTMTLILIAHTQTLPTKHALSIYFNQ